MDIVKMIMVTEQVVILVASRGNGGSNGDNDATYIMHNTLQKMIG